MKIGKWSTVAANNSTTPPDGWPEGQAPSTVNDCAREMMAAVRTYTQDAEWFDHDFTPVFATANSFNVAGDQTLRLIAGRKLKLFDATTIYRSIDAAVFGGANTLVSLGAGAAITASLSSFAVSVHSPTNQSFPDRISTSAIEVTGAFTAGAAVTMLSTLTVSGATAINGALTVGGAATFGSTLTVSGVTMLVGAAACGSTLTVSGATALGSTLTVSGAVAMLGNANVAGKLSTSACVVTGVLSATNAAKAYCEFSGVGVVTLGNAFNVTSITDNGVGDYTINMTNALANSAYCVTSFCESDNVAQVVTEHLSGSVKTTTAYQLRVRTVTGSLTDSPSVSAAFFGV